MRRARSIGLIFAVLSSLGLPVALSAQEEPDPPARKFLFKDARGEVALARVRGESELTLVIASMPGSNGRVARFVEEAGGRIQYREDRVDYLRAAVPLDVVEELVSHEDVHSIDASTHEGRPFTPSEPGIPSGARETPSDADRPVPTDPGAVQEMDTIWPPVPSDHPLSERYHPLEDMGGSEWRDAHPTWDGRGVTIAMTDLSPDPLLPELQQALTLEGEVVPKFSFYATATDREEERNGRWLLMEAEVTADEEGRFVYDSVTYTAPGDGRFRIEVLDEAAFDSVANSDVDGDLNRDGNPEGSSRLFAVLWDREADRVWVDTDQDRDFRDEKTLTDFARSGEFGVLGTDDPETPVRESVGFAVQTAPEEGRIALNMGIGGHASLVIGAAVASRGEEGRFEGMAPGARFASVAEGYAHYGQVEATIMAARDADADIVYFEHSSGITRPYLLRDGRMVPTVVTARVVREWGSTILSPTHNYPVLGAADDFVLGEGVIGVGGHESRENFFRNHGILTEHEDNLLVTGGYGPMGNGALEPDIISPSNYVSTALGFEPGDAIPGLFQLPPGYTIAGGTSTATPTAAGAVALLMSAARQSSVGHDAARVEKAVARSARWVDHLPAYKQGNGVFDIARAWELLQAFDEEGAVDVTIESRGPVRHAYSHLLPEPHRGLGLYEREGWRVGDREERTLTFVRRTGPDEPMTFGLTWAGNQDGTFSAPPTLTLPLGTPVDVVVEVAPGEPGAHTAHLTLEHPDVPGWAHRVLLAVVAPRRLTPEDGWSSEVETTVPRPGMRSLFYEVPEGVDALRVGIEPEERGVSAVLVRPDTREVASLRRDPDETDAGTILVRDPPPGLWELRLDDVADTRVFDWEHAREGGGPPPPTPVKVHVSVLDVDVSGGGAEILVANRKAPLTGALVGLPMGSAREERRTISEGAQHVYEVEVPAGATHLMARAGGWSGPDTDLDLYLFDCTDAEEGCRGAGVDGDPRGEERVVVEEPAAGSWKVVVDAFRVPGDRDTYDYLDVAFAPVFGTTGAADAPEERATAATWDVTTHGWVVEDSAVRDDGRHPLAAVALRSAEGELAVFTLPGAGEGGSGEREER